MKSENLLKAGKHCVGYLSDVPAPYPNQTGLGCEVDRRMPHQPPSSVNHVPNGNHGSRHVAFVTLAGSDMPIQMKGSVRGGSAVFGRPTPITHRQIKSIA